MQHSDPGSDQPQKISASRNGKIPHADYPAELGMPIINKPNEHDLLSRVLSLSTAVKIHGGLFLLNSVRLALLHPHPGRPSNPSHYEMNAKIAHQATLDRIDNNLIEERAGKTFAKPPQPSLKGRKIPSWIINCRINPKTAFSFLCFSEKDAHVATRNLYDWTANPTNTSLLTTIPFHLLQAQPSGQPTIPQQQILIGTLDKSPMPDNIRSLFTLADNFQKKVQDDAKKSKDPCFLSILGKYPTRTNEEKFKLYTNTDFLDACKEYTLQCAASNNTNSNMYKHAVQLLELNNLVCSLGYEMGKPELKREISHLYGAPEKPIASIDDLNNHLRDTLRLTRSALSRHDFANAKEQQPTDAAAMSTSPDKSPSTAAAAKPEDADNTPPRPRGHTI